MTYINISVYKRCSNITVRCFQNFFIYTQIRARQQLIQKIRPNSHCTLAQKIVLHKFYCHINTCYRLTHTSVYINNVARVLGGGSARRPSVKARAAHCRPVLEKQVSMQPPTLNPHTPHPVDRMRTCMPLPYLSY